MSQFFSPFIPLSCSLFLYHHTKNYSLLWYVWFSFFVSLPEQQTISFLFLFFLSFFVLSLSLTFLSSVSFLNFFFLSFFSIFRFPLVHSSHSSPSPFLFVFPSFFFDITLFVSLFHFLSISFFLHLFFLHLCCFYLSPCCHVHPFFSISFSLILPLRLFCFTSSTFRCLLFSLLFFFSTAFFVHLLFSVSPLFSVSRFCYVPLFLHLLFLFFASVPFLFLSLLRFLVSSFFFFTIFFFFVLLFLSPPFFFVQKNVPPPYFPLSLISFSIFELFLFGFFVVLSAFIVSFLFSFVFVFFAVYNSFSKKWKYLFLVFSSKNMCLPISFMGSFFKKWFLCECF